MHPIAAQLVLRTVTIRELWRSSGHRMLLPVPSVFPWSFTLSTVGMLSNHAFASRVILPWMLFSRRSTYCRCSPPVGDIAAGSSPRRLLALRSSMTTPDMLPKNFMTLSPACLFASPAQFLRLILAMKSSRSQTTALHEHGSPAAVHPAHASTPGFSATNARHCRRFGESARSAHVPPEMLWSFVCLSSKVHSVCKRSHSPFGTLLSLAPSDHGTQPVSALPLTARVDSCVRLPRSVGIVPPNLLLSRRRLVRFVIAPKYAGSFHDSWLPPKCNS